MQTYRVKYIGGSGIELPYALQDGRTSLPGHQTITLEHYADFVRLTESPLFLDETTPLIGAFEDKE